MKSIPEMSFRPSEWLSSVVHRMKPFVPQMKDDVIYFRQGVLLYLQLCSTCASLILIRRPRNLAAGALSAERTHTPKFAHLLLLIIL